MDYNTSHKNYENYIRMHCLRVEAVWSQAKNKILSDFPGIETQMNDLIINHDKSKLSDDEFNAYRVKFYPADNDDDDDIQDDFDRAWNHHQKNNPHHWQYWLMWRFGETRAIRMDDPYIFEMLCDWTAMSIKFNDIPTTFYENNKESMLLHPGTIEMIERYIKIFDEIALLDEMV